MDSKLLYVLKVNKELVKTEMKLRLNISIELYIDDELVRDSFL